MTGIILVAIIVINPTTIGGTRMAKGKKEEIVPELYDVKVKVISQKGHCEIITTNQLARTK